MLWGGTAVPALGLWVAGGLGAVLLLAGQWLIARGVHRRTVTLLAILLSLIVPVSVAVASLPFTFTNGTIADANQVNSNFGALDSRVTALQAKSTAAFGVQRTAFTYDLLTSPTMTLTVAPGTYTLIAAGCATPLGGTFLTKATLRINGTATDSAILNPNNTDCFTLINSVTFSSVGTVSILFSNGGGQGGAQTNVSWARLYANTVDSASLVTVTN
jgi:hypothetical protein